jgi:peptidoglycan/xylan/chitin deacetylase (PgdA/CDA1 family)
VIPKKLLPVVAALSAFMIFAHLASSRRPNSIQRLVVKPIAGDTAAEHAMIETYTKEYRKFALELPDSILPFRRGLSSRKEIALSFDACPTSGENHFNKTIANILMETKTPATIFMSGRWVEQDSAATRLLASDSLIEFGNHSFTHPHLTHLTEAKIRRELERTQKIIANVTGQTPFLFRAPYGEYNDTLISIAKKLGLATVQFSVESGDPDTSFTAERLIKWVTTAARNGSIVIMHINNRGWHTAQALPAIISFLREKGYKLVKVSDLMKEVSEEISQSIIADSVLKQSDDLRNSR